MRNGRIDFLGRDFDRDLVLLGAIEVFVVGVRLTLHLRPGHHNWLVLG